MAKRAAVDAEHAAAAEMAAAASNTTSKSEEMKFLPLSSNFHGPGLHSSIRSNLITGMNTCIRKIDVRQIIKYINIYVNQINKYVYKTYRLTT